MYSDEGHLSYVVICVCKWVVEAGLAGRGGENNTIGSKQLVYKLELWKAGKPSDKVLGLKEVEENEGK